MGSSVSISAPPSDLLLLVLQFLFRDWKARVASLRVCKGWHAALTKNDELFWHSMCRFAESEYPIACPAYASQSSTWRNLFMTELVPLLQHSSTPMLITELPALKLEVYVRFRPAGIDGLVDSSNPNNIIIPLHQRLQSLKAMRNSSISTSEAAELLFGSQASTDKWALLNESEQGDATQAASTSSEADACPALESTEQFADSIVSSAVKAASASAEANACPALESTEQFTDSIVSSAVTSAAASRAVSPFERGMTDQSEPAVAAAVLSVQSTSVLCMYPSVGLRQFSFNRVFDDTHSNLSVYSHSVQSIITGFLNGKSGCIMAYGPTGSGKTHTMFGHDEASACDVHASVLGDSSAGLAPRACATTLVELARRRQMYARGILDQEPPELWVSFVQVYGNEVTDLLAGASGRRDSAPTQIGAWGGVAAAAVSAGHGEVFVNDATALQQLLLTGERAKRRAATAMNARSSRAHTLLTLRLRTVASRRPGGKTASTRLVIADLGGCERLKKSGATESKQRMKEAININVGLLALQNCITALVEQAKHVPFADSRLTSLLASALQSAAAAGGRVAMIIAGRTDPAHAPETLRALRFGETAGQAAMGGQNVSHQADASAALAALTAELDAVEAAIAKTERWDKGKPVGAEALRERQSSLLAAQKVLCGTR